MERYLTCYQARSADPVAHTDPDTHTGGSPAMAQKIGGKRGRPAKTPKKGPWRPTPPDGKSLKDVAGVVEDLKWCCDLVRD